MQILVSQKIVSKKQYDQATVLQASNGGTIGYHLVSNKIISNKFLVKFLVTQFSIKQYSYSDLLNIKPDIIKLLTMQIAQFFRILPIKKANKTLVLGMTDPSLTHVIDELYRLTNYKIDPVIISENDMTWAINYYFTNNKNIKVETSPLLEQSTKSEEHTEIPLPLTVKKFDAHDDYIIRETIAYEDPANHENTANIYLNENTNIEKLSLAIPLITRRSKISSSSSTDSKQFHNDTSDQLYNVGNTIINDSWNKPAKASFDRPSTKKIKPQQKTESKLLEGIYEAQNNDIIIKLALEYMMRFAKRAIFFVVQKSKIKGHEIMGEFTCQDAARSFWIPKTAQSTLCRVSRKKQIHLGSLDGGIADDVLSAALGNQPSQTLIIPIVITNKTIGLLYADRIDLKLPPWNRLERLSKTVSSSFLRLLKNKGKSAIKM